MKSVDRYIFRSSFTVEIRSCMPQVSLRVLDQDCESYWLAVLLNGEVSREQYLPIVSNTNRFRSEYVEGFKEFSKITEWEF